MNNDMIECFMDKKVCIFLINGYVYNGKITKVSLDCILLDDKKWGLMTVQNDDISNIEMRENGR